MCGVLGIRAPERDVARLAYFGLFALQHRGQESAGVAVSDGKRLTALRDMGLVTQVFSEDKLSGLRGDAAIAHCRYSTTGSTSWGNAQPIVQHGRARTVALGHNGNLTNTAELREELRSQGVKLGTTSDTEVIAALVAHDERPLEEAVAETMRRIQGAFSAVLLSEGKLIGLRDPNGIRPLVLGRLDDDPVLASETCALDLLGAELEREIEPGELVVVDEEGVRASAGRRRRARPARSASSSSSTSRGPTRRCAASSSTGPACGWASGSRPRRPSTRTSSCRSRTRARLRRSASPARAGFRTRRGSIKNRYVGRTFIQPDQALREHGIKTKFNPLAEVAGKRVVVVDDSIVRGSTTRKIVQMLFESGALEVHVRVSSPPIVSPCFYGIDMASEGELLAAGHSIDEIRDLLGATSVAYLSLDGLQAATRRPAETFCRACLTRRYPTEIPEDLRLAKLRFEPARA